MSRKENQAQPGHAEERPMRRFSSLIDAYRKDVTQYLAKISKEARDDFARAIDTATVRKESRRDATDLSHDTDRNAAHSSAEIQAYLERLEEIFRESDAQTRARRMQYFKEHVLYPFLLVKPEHFPENPFEHAAAFARNRGMGELEISEEDRRQEIASTRERQKISLDRWVDYLAGDDCRYPSDIKYFAMQGVLAMGTFRDGVARKRNRNTTAELPQLDRDALSTVLGALEAVYYSKATSSYAPKLLELIAKRASFGDMYAYALHTLEAQAGEKPLEITEGQWERFEKGSDPAALVERLNRGKYRHYLCIGDIGSATQYLAKGSLEVYFSNDRRSKPEVPRIALAVSEGLLYEVRGTWDKDENMDPCISQTQILHTKVRDIPNGRLYLQKDACMKRLTALYDRCFLHHEKGASPQYLAPELSKPDLLFLYEIESSIEGFGYERDPRIAEIRSKRNAQKDMLVVFGDENGDCRPDQIARTPKEIDERTKAYVGPLQEGLFTLLPRHVQHIYNTSFPEGRIPLEPLELGNLTAQELEAELDATDATGNKRCNVNDYARSMFKDKERYIDPVNQGKRRRKGSKETLDLVRLRVRDLGYSDPNHLPTTRDILGDPGKKNGRIHALGLELCPPETGPYKRLADKDQPLGNWYYIGMEPIAGSDGIPGVFSLGRGEGGVWLDGGWARPGYGWNLGNELVLRLRKSGA